MSRLNSFDAPIGAEEAEKELRGLGQAALPVLLPMLAVRGQAWRAAKILADIGQSEDSVIDALDTAVIQLDRSDQMWAARALSRLGRLDLVLGKLDRLPEETMIAAVAAPFTAFRDQALSALPLDYRQLEDFIDRYPAYVPALEAELKPGSPYCEITAGEVDEAIRGLASSHVLVRQHATDVLGERSLGRRAAKRVLPLLGQIAVHDPDASVRRLAILSLWQWQKDARQYADLIRKALEDPAADVRAAAAFWLREQSAGHVS